MTLCLETKKLKRTGYLIAFPAGGLLAAAFPLVNMLVRPEAFTSLPGSPLAVLLDANWQMMAMLNILVSICGACIMYHTEYADNGAQKMELLPSGPGRLFGWKFVLAALALASHGRHRDPPRWPGAPGIGSPPMRCPSGRFWARQAFSGSSHFPR